VPDPLAAGGNRDPYFYNPFVSDETAQ